PRTQSRSDQERACDREKRRDNKRADRQRDIRGGPLSVGSPGADGRGSTEQSGERNPEIPNILSGLDGADRRERERYCHGGQRQGLKQLAPHCSGIAVIVATLRASTE